MDAFTVAWIIWALAFCIIEGIALHVGHGTLSAHIWALQRYPVTRALVMAVAVWLVGWHLGLEELMPASVRKTHADDGFIAATVFAFTLFVTWLSRRGNTNA